jgi:hypothetical protein
VKYVWSYHPPTVSPNVRPSQNEQFTRNISLEIRRVRKYHRGFDDDLLKHNMHKIIWEKRKGYEEKYI